MVRKRHMSESEREPKRGPFYSATGRVLRNIQGGFKARSKTLQDAAEAVELSDHTPVSKILAGLSPCPLLYIMQWREWLGAPGFWPLESWDDALRRRDRGQGNDVESGQNQNQHRPKLKPVRGKS